jgi:hypothetical protein
MKTTVNSNPLKVNQPGFHVVSADSANSLLREMRRLQAKQARELARHLAAVAAIEGEGEALRSRYEGELQDWVRATLGNGTSGTLRVAGRSLRLAAGVCAFRMVAASVKVIDTDAAVAYVKAKHLRMVERVVTMRLNSLAYRALARTTMEKNGTLLPGIESTPEHETFSIKLEGS